ncbi:AAA family ATPase [Pseudobacteroides cellulosolvens]|uniref:Endonuclease GajA/Old nuclease/RecF-like AAA domain-containing protein n=1 Tax=Pseudobacteroides cellulosolvens ATCC 35603 = DSM 2933 TaxID=398512 RepID=A0A0L6JRJ8_9FIRM|nr:AAA family ATPase [Pseudobacteroides cellulosolvens]KNY28310.1 hypothetical protein Bccel_3584 [Pseudobacteroides cellulosolvens ATCC 35603 = DSM 2933]
MINRVEVKKLFGLYDYDIPLNTEVGITIIYGMNGSGKTTLLNMIKNAIQQNRQKYNLMSNYKFNEFNIYLDDMFLSFDNSNDEYLSVKFRINNDKIHSFNYPKKRERYDNWRRVYTEDGVIIENRMYRNVIAHERDGTIIYADDQYLSIDDNVEAKSKKIMDKLDNAIKERVSVHFIETQRLLDLSNTDQDNNVRREKNGRVIEIVDKYSFDLAKRIQRSLTDYSEISQKLDKTFPERLLKRSEYLSETQINDKLSQLEEKRIKLGKAGFLEESDNVSFYIPNNVSIQDLKVLTVYVEDVESKLSVFDNLLIKIENLIKLLQFSHKELYIDKTKGFIFKNDNGDEILPRQLSSGEQHELVIMYQLIFMLNNNVLILIDEPELSLHVVWQKSFINNIKTIMQSTKFNVLIATHSPQIINNYWECTFALNGGEKDNEGRNNR